MRVYVRDIPQAARSPFKYCVKICAVRLFRVNEYASMLNIYKGID